MPEVVSDTSPLQYLYQAERLDLLPSLYQQIVVPEGVAEEIAAGRALGHSLPDLTALGWVRIEAVPHRRILLLATDLGKGEREVLSLVADRPGAVALLDDGLARRMAAHLGVPFTGTLGVLLRAKAAGYIDSVAPIVDRLEALGFRLDAVTRIAILELAQEG
jgi:predicted nucleic acid-binding protein